MQPATFLMVQQYLVDLGIEALINPLFQLLRTDWFRQKGAKNLSVLSHIQIVGRLCYDGQVRAKFLDKFCCQVSVHLRHFDIHQNQADFGVVVAKLHRLNSCSCLEYFATGISQKNGEIHE